MHKGTGAWSGMQAHGDMHYTGEHAQRKAQDDLCCITDTLTRSHSHGFIYILHLDIGWMGVKWLKICVSLLLGSVYICEYRCIFFVILLNCHLSEHELMKRKSCFKWIFFYLSCNRPWLSWSSNIQAIIMSTRYTLKLILWCLHMVS